MKKKDHINGLVVIPLLMVALAFQVSAEPESSGSIENKEVLTFKLMRGTQYPMCHEYVAMLNKTGYTEPPICDRIILPEFKKFKAVPWAEIDDREDIKKNIKLRLKMASLSPLSREGIFEERWAAAKKRMDDGIWPRLFVFKTNIGNEYKNVSIYRSVSESLGISEHRTCKELKSYFADYGELNNIIYSGVSRPFSTPLIMNANIFLYDGRLYQDYWLGLNAQYHLKLNEISGIPDQVCAVNVINKGEGK